MTSKTLLAWSASVFMLSVQWAFLAPPATAAEPAPVAMTTDVQGAAWLVEGGKQSRLGLLQYLPAGASLRLDAGARVAITYFAVPREFTLGGPAQAVVDAERLRGISGATPATKNLDRNQVAAGQKFSARQRERQAVATFEMKAFEPGSLQLRQPVDTRLLGDPEEFSWRPLLGAKTYRFSLADANGQVLYSAAGAARSLRLPASVKLQPGLSYSWSVEAQGSSGLLQSASAGFSLLDAASARAIAAQQPAADASFSERLLYASLLEDAGLKLAATAYWKTLASERPDDELLQELGNR